MLAVGPGVAPWTAVSCRDTAHVARVEFRLEQLLHFLGCVCYSHAERWIADPVKRAAGCQAEQADHPLQGLFAAAAPEVGVEGNLVDGHARLLSVRLDVFHRAHFT